MLALSSMVIAVKQATFIVLAEASPSRTSLGEMHHADSHPSGLVGNLHTC